MSTHESLQRLLNTAVFDLNGVRSGRLADVLVDPRDGRVDYVRIALDPSESGAWRTVVVPWSTLSIEREPAEPTESEERWFVKVRRETLERLARLESRTAARR